MFNLKGLMAPAGGDPNQGGMARGMKLLNDPAFALPVAAALMSGKNNRQAFGQGLGMAGMAAGKIDARDKAEAQKNKTVQWLRQYHPEVAAQVAAGMPMDVAMGMATAKPAARKVIKGADGYNYYEDGSRVLPGVEGKPQMGWSVETADGTRLTYGPDKREVEGDAKRLAENQDAAASANALKQTVQSLRVANKNTGYSGVGGKVVGGILDAGEQLTGYDLPGSPGARKVMESGALNAALEMTQKTKGAISNTEMNLFVNASGGLTTTPEGNEALYQMMEAVADRAVMRVNEMERWRAANGSLRGFEGAWNTYLENNPIITQSETGGIQFAGQITPFGAAPSQSSPRTTSGGVNWSIDQ